MRFLKAMLATVAIAVPLTVWAGSTTATDTLAAPSMTVNGEVRTPENYDCCWIYMMGRWYCYSCVMGELE
jgi:hypothetical protein